jgi:hypothetical protein
MELIIQPVVIPQPIRNRTKAVLWYTVQKPGIKQEQSTS